MGSARELGGVMVLALCCMLAAFQPVQEEPGSDPPALLFLGWWDRAQPALFAAGTAEEVPIDVLTIGDRRLETVDLEGRKAVLIGQISPEEAHVLRRRIEGLPEGHGVDFLLAVDRSSHDELSRHGLARRDPAIQAFCYPPSADNYRGLLRFLAIRYLGAEGETPVPAPPPAEGVYRPEASELFEDVASLEAWERARRGDSPTPAHTVALQVQGDYIHLGDAGVIDALIRALEQRELRVVTVFGQEAFLRESVAAARPDLVMTLRHSGVEDERRRGGDPTFLERLDVPYLGPLSMLSQSWRQWRDESRGVLETSALVTPRELHGIIEPEVIGGVEIDARGLRIHTPDAELLDRFCDRALAWIRLREKPASEKRIAVLYYHKYLGKGDVGRSRSVSGMFLDTHASLVSFAAALRERGYRVEGFPANADELVELMQEKGSTVPSWAPGELARLVRNGDPVLVPVEDYERWYREELPPEARRAVEAVFGPPPGKLMVWRDGDRAWIVLPVLRFGNLLLAPQPDRGDIQDARLIHDRRTPPPHQYLAFYLWLRRGFGADAVVHFGTHGSEIYLPGKDVGLARGDFPAICLGDLPNVNPWILDNLGEAIIAKRRASAVLIDHLGPPTTAVHLDPERRGLLEDLDLFAALPAGAVREEARRNLSRRLVELELAAVAGTQEPEDGYPDAVLLRVADYLRELWSETVTLGLHRLGKPPEGERLEEYLETIVEANPDYAKDEAAMAELRGDLTRCGDEVTRIVDALDGRFIPAGPGPGPDRNPRALPTGRNLFGLDPEIVPTREAWRVAEGLVKEILAAEEKRTEAPVRQLAFNLNGMETFRDFGVMEAQILQLLGVRPIWSPGGRIVDLEPVPREELGRPRCDVFIAVGAIYLKNCPTRVLLLDRAVRLAAAQVEPDNTVRARTQQIASALAGEGVPPERAGFLAGSRVFGTAPGGGGFRLEYLFPRSGEWEDAGSLFRAYQVNASHLYSTEIWGEPLERLYERAIGSSQAVVTTWGSRMVSPLANHHEVEGTGGLSTAVEQVSGEPPAAYVSDLRSRGGPTARELDALLLERLGAELLDPAWISALMKHDFGGAGQMAELVRNAFGWRALRESSMPEAAFESIASVYVDDSRDLDLREWFEKVNPYAFQTITAVLLECSRRSFWQPSPERLHEVARAYADSVARFGYNHGAIEGGNARLREVVEGALADPEDQALLTGYVAQLEAAESEPGPEERPVVGALVEERPRSAEESDAEGTAGITTLVLALAAAAAFLFGWSRRVGGHRRVA